MTPTILYRCKKIAAKDGTNLHVHSWRQDKTQRPMGRVLLVHGYLEHAGRYGALSEVLAQKGLEVVACDLRGHGKSDGRRGHISSFKDYIDDLEITMDQAERNLPLPWWMIGHSLGGLITLDALSSGSLLRKRAVCGAVVTNPFLAPALHIPRYKRILGRALSDVWPSVALPAGISFEALTRDPDMIRALESDPLITHRATARWFTETTSAQLRVLATNRIESPLWALVSRADTIADAAVTCQWYERLEAPRDRQLEVYGKKRHELFFEVDRRQLYEAVTSWILAHRPGA